MPRFQIKANASEQVATRRLALPGGHTLWVDAIDPVRRMARIRVDGLNLPVEPGLAVITISLKPGIALVWAGVLIGVTGGLIALARRALEGRARPRSMGAPAAGLGWPGQARAWRDAARMRGVRNYSDDHAT